MTGTVKDHIAARLTETRERTLGMLAPLTENVLCAQHSPLMSPLLWDLAHIGNYEDQWLLRALGSEGVGSAYDDLYDAFRHPRRSRSELALLTPSETLAYNSAVREQTLRLLSSVELDQSRLTMDGFVYGMVIQHEQQHAETMLATIQLADLRFPPAQRTLLARVPTMSAPTPTPSPAFLSPAFLSPEVFVPGGRFRMGSDTSPWAYDNEGGAHEIDVAPFWIDATGVTNEAYAQFVADGGYDDERLWTATGWAWRCEAQLSRPEFWTPGTDAAEGNSVGWLRNRFGWIEPVPPEEPVQHVCWYEADAFTRWAGRRLPTEAEWEKAACWSPSSNASHTFPWGEAAPSADLADLAMLGSERFGPAPVRAFPAGASPCGALGMVGGVWEWTASDFTVYPGFEAFPYKEYSQVFFGTDYKVLRGGSWATAPDAIRGTFRNWDYPIRRQIFAGFRSARNGS